MLPHDQVHRNSFSPAGSLEVQDVALVGGSVEGEGRVEVRLAGGQAGSLCSPRWEDAQAALAEVVCRQLGLPGPPLARSNGLFGGDAPPGVLDVDECQGGEASVEECVAAPAADPACPAFGVACNGERGGAGGTRTWVGWRRRL